LTILIICGEDHRSISSSLCSFVHTDYRCEIPLFSSLPTTLSTPLNDLVLSYHGRLQFLLVNSGLSPIAIQVVRCLECRQTTYVCGNV
jgi:hypothetical protein